MNNNSSKATHMTMTTAAVSTTAAAKQLIWQ